MAKKDKNPKMQKTGQNTDQTAKMPKRENWKDQKDMKLKTNKTAADAVTLPPQNIELKKNIYICIWKKKLIRIFPIDHMFKLSCSSFELIKELF